MVVQAIDPEGLPVPLRALVGPTATGKSDLALRVAELAGAEVVSLDSMLVYRGLDVGTAKPSAADRARVRHHLLDRVAPSEPYDVQRYLADVRGAVAEIAATGRWALFVGGSGFYLKALTHGLFRGPDVEPGLRAELEARGRAQGPAALHAELASVDPRSAARLHPHDVRRVVRALEVLLQSGRPLSEWQREWNAGPGRPRRLVGLDLPREAHERRIRERVAAMLDAGWAAEARRLRRDPGLGPTAVQALGLPEILRHADGELDRAEVEELVALRTRQFARRQRTWFRKFPEIEWRRAPENAAEAERLAGEVALLLAEGPEGPAP